MRHHLIIDREAARRGMSTRALARRAAMNPTVLSRYRRGRVGIHTATFERLCRALGLSLKREEHP